MQGEAKPATSVHLRYKFERQTDNFVDGAAQVGLTVKQTYPGTYFCAIQFPPSGYCGLQELANGDKVAIFSVWDKGPKGSPGAQSLATGNGFQASAFGGEGEGCRILGPFDWEINECVVFRVTWEREVNQLSEFESWQISCWANKSFIGMIRFHAGPHAETPVQHLLSFVEDFDRQRGMKGMEQQRTAMFSQVEWPQLGELCAVKFTRVENGLDSTGTDRTHANAIQVNVKSYTPQFVLSTGGVRPKNMLANNAVIWENQD